MNKYKGFLVDQRMTRKMAIGKEDEKMAKKEQKKSEQQKLTWLQCSKWTGTHRNGVPVREMDRCNLSVSSKYVRTHKNAVPVRHFSIIITSFYYEICCRLDERTTKRYPQTFRSLFASEEGRYDGVRLMRGREKAAEEAVG